MSASELVEFTCNLCGSANRRLAFRELGLAIGLAAAGLIGAGETLSESGRTMLEGLRDTFTWYLDNETWWRT